MKSARSYILCTNLTFPEWAVPPTLSNRTEIAYEQEIPLAVQIITSQNKVYSYFVESYFHPEEYAKYNYEHVYAITICFSQNPLS